MLKLHPDLDGELEEVVQGQLTRFACRVRLPRRRAHGQPRRLPLHRQLPRRLRPSRAGLMSASPRPSSIWKQWRILTCGHQDTSREFPERVLGVVGHVADQLHPGPDDPVAGVEMCHARRARPSGTQPQRTIELDGHQDGGRQHRPGAPHLSSPRRGQGSSIARDAPSLELDEPSKEMFFLQSLTSGNHGYELACSKVQELSLVFLPHLVSLDVSLVVSFFPITSLLIFI